MKQSRHLKGELRVPGDKSISHRALIFSVLTRGRSTVSGLSPAFDCGSSITCLKAFGLEISPAGSVDKVSIQSDGFGSFKAPTERLDAGNSGTTIRMMAGVACGLPFKSVLDGDQSLRRRPMSRVLDPLCKMGAQIDYLEQHGYAPFAVSGGALHGIDYQVPVASAQVQTAVLLAGLQADGETTVTVAGSVRDHTQRLFEYLEIPHESEAPGTIKVKRLQEPIAPYQISVPADISSAAFFMVAAALLPGSSIFLKDIGMNPGRTLVVDVLKRMGADLSVENNRIIAGEPVADIAVRHCRRLTGATVDGDEIATGIDEIPILALAGALCDGRFTVTGADELRVKESDRLKAIISNLRAAGAQITELPDGFEIEGQQTIAGGSPWETFGDHRLAMSGLIASILSTQPIAVDDRDCVKISYPTFEEDLEVLLVP